MKSFYRTKQKERICLVSDVSSIAGLPPGIYGRSYGSDEVEIHENGKISLAGTPYLAGASLFLDYGIPNTVAYTDATLAEAFGDGNHQPGAAAGRGRQAGPRGARNGTRA